MTRQTHELEHEGLLAGVGDDASKRIEEQFEGCGALLFEC